MALNVLIVTLSVVGGKGRGRGKEICLYLYLYLYLYLCGIIYTIYGHWVWGGGWLATLPFGAEAKDFSGDDVE
ncbi:MAG TPA: hypothetical protein VI387_14370 [Candidatus Brocadiales bacterium]|nr:hypothetical protein [Candidatus Brocadiales bacterium]